MGNVFKIECNGCLGDVFEGRIGMRIWMMDYRNERSCLKIERWLFILSRNGEV